MIDEAKYWKIEVVKNALLDVIKSARELSSFDQNRPMRDLFDFNQVVMSKIVDVRNLMISVNRYNETIKFFAEKENA